MSLWKAPAYQEHLQKLRPGEEDEGPSMINAMSWQDRSGGGASLTGGGAALGNVGATASVLETLVRAPLAPPGCLATRGPMGACW